MEKYGVFFCFGVGVSEIIGSFVRVVKIGDEEVFVDFVLVVIGVRVNIDFVK